MDASILDGVVIGGVGGAIAGLTVWLTQLAQTTILESRDKGRVYCWLLDNTKNEAGEPCRGPLLALVGEVRRLRGVALGNELDNPSQQRNDAGEH